MPGLCVCVYSDLIPMYSLSLQKIKLLNVLNRKNNAILVIFYCN